ncbi:serine hydrolase [Paraburkholderia rhizosphaerae]|uniref:Uncharacterized protein YbbC (DUF1343 family) n=1 Tax=Paraburkholderia rhizosphaerae TaxID=480658 RepID=A0A4R8LTB3_9BURK|nr:serine hydrolase [Paraburkholderia rhizosphaerae]TDY50940.1 uncharacterized protein YbbC (DUF1343 family) [Paraburkholderia rhizosphaerae]
MRTRLRFARVVSICAAAFVSLPAAAGDPEPFNATARGESQRIVDAQIAAGHVPGAVVIAGDAQRVLYRTAAGRRSHLQRDDAMTADTVFDLASLTKVIATTTAVLQLAEHGRLQLDAPVARYWPAFAAHGKGTITVRELLAHTSGLPAELPSRYGAGVASRAATLRAASALAPRAPPGVQVLYSDVNFLVLGALVERVTGERLDAYCRGHIFAPLGMRDTTFVPESALARRAAPTSADAQQMRRARVHDPLAARMGGVAGNAGLFSTADDLARFAQMMLLGGTLGGARVLRADSIVQLAAPASPLDALPWRGLGWALAAPLAANRDRLPPAGSIYHTGYTGTAIWIDFVTQRFLIVLTNRVYPDGSGDAGPLREQLSSLVASLSAPVATAGIEQRLPSVRAAIDAATRLPRSSGPVRTGIDVLVAQRFAPLAGMRIGLVTNRSGFDATGQRTIDLLQHADGVALAVLFAPEHGLATNVDAPVADTRDPQSGLVVRSLYGESRRVPADALANLDALVFDIQDAGVRFFTYETTLGFVLEAAAARHIPVFVLDRPDPLGADRAGGPRLDAGRESFTGYFPLPLMPGMTLGELATLFNGERRIGADLRVVPMAGYRRAMRFADTGLGWVPLSPNLRSPAALDLYPDVALVEGANLSVGRGTPNPFEWIGAPWIDGVALAAALNAASSDAHFAPIDFVPTESTWRGALCHGVRIASAHARREPGSLGLALLATLRRLYPEQFDFAATRDAIGSTRVWTALARDASAADAASVAASDSAAFMPLREHYLIYRDDSTDTRPTDDATSR